MKGRESTPDPQRNKIELTCKKNLSCFKNAYLDDDEDEEDEDEEEELPAKKKGKK